MKVSIVLFIVVLLLCACAPPGGSSSFVTATATPVSVDSDERGYYVDTGGPIHKYVDKDLGVACYYFNQTNLVCLDLR